MLPVVKSGIRSPDYPKGHVLVPFYVQIWPTHPKFVEVPFPTSYDSYQKKDCNIMSNLLVKTFQNCQKTQLERETLLLVHSKFNTKLVGCTKGVLVSCQLLAIFFRSLLQSRDAEIFDYNGRTTGNKIENVMKEFHTPSKQDFSSCDPTRSFRIVLSALFLNFNPVSKKERENYKHANQSCSFTQWNIPFLICYFGVQWLYISWWSQSFIMNLMFVKKKWSDTRNLSFEN